MYIPTQSGERRHSYEKKFISAACLIWGDVLKTDITTFLLEGIPRRAGYQIQSLGEV